MTDSTPAPTAPPNPDAAASRVPEFNPGKPVAQKAPANAKDADATGYAVYDETLAQFTSSVYADRKDAEAARKDGPESHSLKVVRV